MDLTTISSSVEKKIKEILHFSGQKSVLILLRKTLERASFGKRGRRCHNPPPIPPLYITTQDIQIGKFLNNLLKMANS